jgi:hypothetical protein
LLNLAREFVAQAPVYVASLGTERGREFRGLLPGFAGEFFEYPVA